MVILCTIPLLLHPTTTVRCSCNRVCTPSYETNIWILDYPTFIAFPFCLPIWPQESFPNACPGLTNKHCRTCIHTSSLSLSLSLFSVCTLHRLSLDPITYKPIVYNNTLSLTVPSPARPISYKTQRLRLGSPFHSSCPSLLPYLLIVSTTSRLSPQIYSVCSEIDDLHAS